MSGYTTKKESHISSSTNPFRTWPLFIPTLIPGSTALICRNATLIDLDQVNSARARLTRKAKCYDRQLFVML